MPWNQVSAMTLRKEFVALAQSNTVSISELSRRFGISRKTAYKWLNRAKQTDDNSFEDRSKRPSRSPKKTSDTIENLILSTRLEFSEWGGRKLKRYLENEGHTHLPAPSTITEILRRNDLLNTSCARKSERFIRFEHDNPNDLWQMDFKGPMRVRDNSCSALTILDDHSRFSLGIKICRQQTYADTKKALTDVFRRYGLPRRMTMDNGNPWGIANTTRNWTLFAVWLMDQGIYVSHSRPYHPQTQGKDERFHRSLSIEVLNKYDFKSANELQERCEQWRWIYNEKRPHDALNLEVPASRYRVSQRQYQEKITPYEYSPGDITRKIHSAGELKYKGNIYFIGASLYGKTVALRDSEEDGVMHIFYRHQKIGQLDLRRSDL